MLYFLLACWTKNPGRIPIQDAQEWKKPEIYPRQQEEILQIKFGYGAAYDSIGFEGTAFVMSSLWFDELRYPYSFSIGQEESVLQIVIPSAELDFAMQHVAEVLQHPNWDEQKLQQMKMLEMQLNYMQMQVEIKQLLY